MVQFQSAAPVNEGRPSDGFFIKRSNMADKYDDDFEDEEEEESEEESEPDYESIWEERKERTYERSVLADCNRFYGWLYR